MYKNETNAGFPQKATKEKVTKKRKSSSVGVSGGVGGGA